jgi:hypothetical protein
MEGLASVTLQFTCLSLPYFSVTLLTGRFSRLEGNVEHVMEGFLYGCLYMICFLLTLLWSSLHDKFSLNIIICWKYNWSIRAEEKLIDNCNNLPFILLDIEDILLLEPEGWC